MNQLIYQLRWALPLWFVGLLTNWWPDNRVTIRVRGAMMSPFIGRCGRNFQAAAHVTLLNSDRLTIGDDVYIARGSWLNAMGSLTLEDQVVIAPYVVISSVQHVFQDGSVRFGGSISGRVIIGRGTWLAAHAAVKCGVRVGAGNLVAANSAVVTDTPDHVIVGGVPAKVLRPNTDQEASFHSRAEFARHD